MDPDPDPYPDPYWPPSGSSGSGSGSVKNEYGSETLGTIGWALKRTSTTIQTKKEQSFGGFFSSNKSALANKKKGFSTNRDPKKQVGGWINFCMKRLRTLKSFKIVRSEI